MGKPIGRPLPTARVKEILRVTLGPTGTVEFNLSPHSVGELWADDLTTVDAENVLRAGIVRTGHWRSDCWRYKVWTARITFVILVESERAIRVVTAWRNER